MAEERPVSIDKQWARVRARMRREVGESVYRNWLRSLTMDRVEGATAILVASTPFFRDRIIAQFEDRLALSWAVESNDDIDRVEIISAGRSGKSAPKAVPGDDDADIDLDDDAEDLDGGATRRRTRRRRPLSTDKQALR